MANNKIIYGNQVLIDLTNDDVTPADVALNKQFHDRAGNIVKGTSTLDSDTKDADATAAELLDTKTAYVNGQKIVGTMPNIGQEVLEIADVNTPVYISKGFHDGTGSAVLDPIESAKLIPTNIKDGVNILGVVGTYSGTGAKAQAKTVTPKTTAQTLLPDPGFDYLSQVDVDAIAYVVTPNSAGGDTVTIGTV